MKRREALLTIAITGSGMALDGCAHWPSTQEEMTDAEVAKLVKMMTGMDTTLRQAAEVRKVLAMCRFKGAVDPRVQPSLIFDPEVILADELAFASIAELSSWIQQKKVSSEEIVRDSIGRTNQFDPKLNSYITFLRDQALVEARKADQEIRRGRYSGPLYGIPVSIKDHIDTEGIPTTAGARFQLNNIPKKDAAVVRRLKQAGAIIMGKSNMNKFAGGESGDNPDFGKIKTPWNLEFSAGGSSGGSGAQVAASLVPLSIGSDNAGSIRIPAALCGVVGLKPTYGRVSLDGVFPRAYTYDHVGPLTRTVEDCAIALQALAGHDPADPATIRKEVPDYRKSVMQSPKRIRVGVDRKFVEFGEPAVLKQFNEALKTFGELGASVQDVTIPSIEDLFAVGYALLPELTVALGEIYRSRPSEFDTDDAAFFRASAVVPAVDYIRGTQQRRVLQNQYAQATRGVDVMLCPSYPLERRPFGKYRNIGGREVTSDDAFRYTFPFDILGLPAISIPCGFSDDGFPIGLQIIGRAFDEPTVLQVAYLYEQATEWHKRRPRLSL